MQASDRIDFYQSVLDTFLRGTREKGYVTFEIVGSPDEYVQYQMHGGRIFGEVGARQWTAPEKPLSPTAVAGLAALGFVGGGPERNHARDGLPTSAAELARLTDTLLRTAYGREDFSPIVSELNLNDVTLPRAEPFTRDMIAAHLGDNDIRFLRDEDGDFRVDLRGDDGDVQTVWFIAEGPGDTIYRISSCAYQVPGTRSDAVERCNAWNSQNRWPKAFVADGEQGWRLVLCADIDLGPGVTRTLFDRFTERVAQGMVGFWTWMAEQDAAPSGDDRQPNHAVDDRRDD